MRWVGPITNCYPCYTKWLIGETEVEIEEINIKHNNLLQKQVTAEDVAEAFFAQLSFEKTTGNIITVDGGNIEASLR